MEIANLFKIIEYYIDKIIKIEYNKNSQIPKDIKILHKIN